MLGRRNGGAIALVGGGASGLASWLICAGVSGRALEWAGDASRGARRACHQLAGADLLFVALVLPVVVAIAHSGLRPRITRAALGTAATASVVARVLLLSRDAKLAGAAFASLLVALALALLAFAVSGLAGRRSADPAISAGVVSALLVLAACSPWLVGPLLLAPGGLVLLRIATAASPLATMSHAVGLDLFRLEAVYPILGLGAARLVAPAWWQTVLGYFGLAVLASSLPALRRRVHPDLEESIR